jgi:hypothetical protein
MNIIRYSVLFVTSFLFLSLTLNVYANPPPPPAAKIVVAPAKQIVLGLTPAIDDLKTQVTIQVLFPSTIPQGDLPHYYAGSDFMRDAKQQQYTLYINATKECKNAHFCNVGTIKGETVKKPEMYKDRDGTPITVPLSLINNITGYYTPGHAMGSYFPPTIQWVDNNVLYTVSWNGGMNQALEKVILTSLAVSMLMK